jgi:hypothetical protein
MDPQPFEAVSSREQDQRERDASLRICRGSKIISGP